MHAGATAARRKHVVDRVADHQHPGCGHLQSFAGKKQRLGIRLAPLAGIAADLQVAVRLLARPFRPRVGVTGQHLLGDLVQPDASDPAAPTWVTVSPDTSTTPGRTTSANAAAAACWSPDRAVTIPSHPV